MSEEDNTAKRAMQRFNLEDMVSRAMDRKFGRSTENTMDNLQQEIIDAIDESVDIIANEFGDEENIEMSQPAQRIYDFLREQSEPLGRSEIIDRISLPEHMWAAAIRELKEEDRVTQHGQRRGAKYTAN